jgi:hypothetical protein
LRRDIVGFRLMEWRMVTCRTDHILWPFARRPKIEAVGRREGLLLADFVEKVLVIGGGS